jgi:hypothetical protein
MRHPVGPLPSSIYWRRRAVVLCLLAAVIALIVWGVTSGGSGNKKNGAGGGHGRQPAQSIEPTPGPSTGTPIDGRPGGHGGAGNGGGSGGGEGSASGGSGGTDQGQGNGGSAGAPGPGSVSGGSVNGGSSSTGGAVPAGSTLPDCAASKVALTLRTTKTAYEPGEQPKFELTLTNSSSAACKVDLGRKATVLTITDTSENHVWSSADCANGATPYLVQVPSDSKTVRSYVWDRERTSPNCATPKGATTASNGTYVVEVSIPGLGTAPATFSLKS